MRLGSYYRTLKLIDKLNELKISKYEKVVDVGAYDGYWLSLIEANLKIALDLYPSKKYDDVSYVRGDALKMPFKNNAFDVVFALDVIEHVSDEIEFINELFRICKKMGYIIITTPHIDLKIFPSFLTDWIHRKWGHYRKKGYDKVELESLFRSLSYNKFEIIKFERINIWLYGRLYLLLRIMWSISRNITKKIMKFLVFIENKKYFSYHGRWMWFVVLKKLE